MKNKLRASDESGAILIIVAISMIALLTLSAGGIMLFTLYGANREMQKAADQAALAGAAALPLLRPGVALSSLPLNPVYSLSSNVGLDVPLKGLSNVPHPFAVACAYGSQNLANNSARLVSIFGSAPSPSLGGYCTGSPWNDGRVLPSLNSLSTPLSTCVNSLTSSINSVIAELQGSLVGLLTIVPGVDQLITNVNTTIDQLTATLNAVKNLEALSPALLTPEMTVRVKSGVKPPMLSFLGGGDGVQMTVEAKAERRLKNAIVLPSTPAFTGASGVDITTALAATKPVIMTGLDAANTQLNTFSNQLGVTGCQNLLSSTSKITQDISDIYNPPASGPTPTAANLVAGAITTAQNAAAGSGNAVDQIAGEAFLVIRQGPTPGTISSALGPLVGLLGLSPLVQSLQVPALDVAAVAAHNLEDGNLSNPDLIPDLASARGLFTATLVK